MGHSSAENPYPPHVKFIDRHPFTVICWNAYEGELTPTAAFVMLNTGRPQVVAQPGGVGTVVVKGGGVVVMPGTVVVVTPGGGAVVGGTVVVVVALAGRPTKMICGK